MGRSSTRRKGAKKVAKDAVLEAEQTAPAEAQVVEDTAAAAEEVGSPIQPLVKADPLGSSADKQQILEVSTESHCERTESQCERTEPRAQSRGYRANVRAQSREHTVRAQSREHSVSAQCEKQQILEVSCCSTNSSQCGTTVSTAAIRCQQQPPPQQQQQQQISPLQHQQSLLSDW